jgi:hypothetical protein
MAESSKRYVEEAADAADAAVCLLQRRRNGKAEGKKMNFSFFAAFDVSRIPRETKSLQGHEALPRWSYGWIGGLRSGAAAMLDAIHRFLYALSNSKAFRLAAP